MSYRSPRPSSPRKLQTHCRIDVRKLDLAKGHDGLLRGRPEPVVVLAVFVREPATLRLVDRRVCTFSCPARFPASAAPHGAMRIDMLLDYEIPAAIVCAGFALELDSGTDVGEATAALERWGRLQFAEIAESASEPRSLLEELDGLVAGDAPRAFDAWIDQRPAAEVFVGDDWVGCSLYALSAHRRRRCSRRMHFTSRDGANDWSLVLDVRLGSPRMWPDA